MCIFFREYCSGRHKARWRLDLSLSTVGWRYVAGHKGSVADLAQHIRLAGALQALWPDIVLQLTGVGPKDGR